MTLHSDEARPRRLSGHDQLTQRQFDEFHDFAERTRRGPGTGSMRQTVGGETRWTDQPSGINRTMVFDPDTGLWQPRSVRARPFDNKYNPSALYGLHVQSLNDSTANAFNLTVENGTQRWTYITPTMGGFLFDGATDLLNNTSSTLLGPTGDMSFLCMGIFERPTGAAVFIAGYDDVSADADPNNNTRWSLFYNTDGSITFISESGAGVNATHTVNSFAPPHQLCMFGFTRISNVVQMYLNGRIWGAASSALTTPDGGSNSRLRFGARETAASPMTGVLASAAIYTRGLTQDEVAERWNYSLGATFGFIEVNE